jgi:hypothetical protein
MLIVNDNIMKKTFLIIMSFSTLILIGCVSCSKNETTKSNGIVPGNDPNFTIIANTDGNFTGFDRKVEVFGVYIYAVPKVEDLKLLHAANVMAQYLDNDEDGNVDNTLVLEEMKRNNAFLIMWASESDMETISVPDNAAGQDLGNNETNPDFVINGKTGDFDAAIEEVLHLINFAGHSLVYPEDFGLTAGSKLADAMDIARGGQFLTIPQSYPENAWYSYDDPTCEYADCQTIEYLYWALTSILGAQENRANEIGHEWKLQTKELVQSIDTSIYNLLTDPKFKMPTILPDGKYKQ